MLGTTQFNRFVRERPNEAIAFASVFLDRVSRLMLLEVDVSPTIFSAFLWQRDNAGIQTSAGADRYHLSYLRSPVCVDGSRRSSESPGKATSHEQDGRYGTGRPCDPICETTCPDISCLSPRPQNRLVADWRGSALFLSSFEKRSQRNPTLLSTCSSPSIAAGGETPMRIGRGTTGPDGGFASPPWMGKRMRPYVLSSAQVKRG